MFELLIRFITGWIAIFYIILFVCLGDGYYHSVHRVILMVHFDVSTLTPAAAAFVDVNCLLKTKCPAVATNR